MAILRSRTHPKELASADEIREMMTKEAKRVPSSNKHFPDFSTVEEWMKVLDIKSDLFRMTKSIAEVAEKANEVKKIVVERTLKQKPMGVLREVENYLGKEDKLVQTDIAIVFGGKTLSRADKGAEMFMKGWAKKLLMTGKGPNYKGVFNRPEAVVFKDRAIELGVPGNKIITEDKSINIPDNVKASLNLLDELGINYYSLMQIISWYAQRRAWVTLKKYINPHVKLIRVNADLPKIDGRKNDYDIGKWYKTGEGIEIVFNEFVKMKHQVVTNSG